MCMFIKNPERKRLGVYSYGPHLLRKGRKGSDTHVNVEIHAGRAVVEVHFVSGRFLGFVVVVGEEVALVYNLALVVVGVRRRVEVVVVVVVVGAVEVDCELQSLGRRWRRGRLRW